MTKRTNNQINLGLPRHSYGPLYIGHGLSGVQAFRYVPENDTVYIDNCSFLIRSLSSHRESEHELRDPFDGAMVWNINTPEIEPGFQEFPHSAPPLVREMLGLSQRNRNISFQECGIIIGYDDAFCFCLSWSSENEYILSKGSTAVYRVHDLNRFGREIEISSNGQLRYVGYCSIYYEDIFRKNYDHRPFDPSPCKKDLRFIEENEVRIIWQATESLPKDGYLIIESSGAAAQMTRVR